MDGPRVNSLHGGQQTTVKIKLQTIKRSRQTLECTKANEGSNQSNYQELCSTGCSIQLYGPSGLLSDIADRQTNYKGVMLNMLWAKGEMQSCHTVGMAIFL